MEINIEELGIETVAEDITNGTFELKEDTFIKFNLPNSVEKFKAGNGEGVWGMPLTAEDEAIYDDVTSFGETFKVVILNDAILYPFRYGMILTAETRGDHRPILSYDWFETVLNEASEGQMKILDFLGV